MRAAHLFAMFAAATITMLTVQTASAQSTIGEVLDV